MTRLCRAGETDRYASEYFAYEVRMALSIDKVIWSTIYAVAGLISFGATLYLLYILMTSGFGMSADKATILTSIVAAISLPAIVYGSYGAIRIKCFGETIDMQVDKIARLIPKSPKSFFLFLIPLLLPTFAYLYSIVLTLFIWIILLPFGKRVEKYPEYSSYAILVIALFFAIATVIGLWRRIKRQQSP